jgi:hypothetical protein
MGIFNKRKKEPNMTYLEYMQIKTAVQKQYAHKTGIERIQLVGQFTVLAIEIFYAALVIKSREDAMKSTLDSINEK